MLTAVKIKPAFILPVKVERITTPRIILPKRIPPLPGRLQTLLHDI
ncbi:hypothetical protein [Escherichia phage dw-ec]|nr:hypothetical protein [Escherichia phage BI-EHEC]UJQ43796.1 hypothetical protein [Escherichia phage dw-ec]